MESNQNSDNLLEDIENNVSNVKIIDCPNCEESVPLSIYCLSCGFPMFDLMKEHQEKEENGEEGHQDLSEVSNESTSDISTELKFRLVPADLVSEDMNEEKSDFEVDDELKLDEEYQTFDVDDDSKTVDSENNVDENITSETLESLATSSHIFDENELKSTMREVNVLIPKREFEPDEATQSLMQNLANSINLKLWSVGQLQDEKISKENFERLHGGYDTRYRQLMDQRNARLEQVSDVKNLEEELERAYICKSELEVRKTLNDLFEGEYQAKAPAYEWDISHCEVLLEHRKGEIAFLTSLVNVVQSDELVKMVKTARSYLECIQSSEGLFELIDGSSGRLKNSLEEIVSFLEDNE